jgi:hypothetical protein
MKTPEQWAQEIELRCVSDNRRPRIAVEADVIREAVNERVTAALHGVERYARVQMDILQHLMVREP